MFALSGHHASVFGHTVNETVAIDSVNQSVMFSSTRTHMSPTLMSGAMTAGNRMLQSDGVEVHCTLCGRYWRIVARPVAPLTRERSSRLGYT